MSASFKGEFIIDVSMEHARVDDADTDLELFVVVLVPMADDDGILAVFIKLPLLPLVGGVDRVCSLMVKGGRDFLVISTVFMILVGFPILLIRSPYTIISAEVTQPTPAQQP